VTLASDVRAVLIADTELMALATGGIYSDAETGRQRLTYADLKDTAAFDGAILQPMIYLYPHLGFSTSAIKDEAGKVSSSYQNFEIRLYQHQGYTIINSMKQRVYELLADENIGRRRFVWAGIRDTRQAEELNGASEMVLDFRTYGLEMPR
jgi:hypothetical protein